MFIREKRKLGHYIFTSAYKIWRNVTSDINLQKSTKVVKDKKITMFIVKCYKRTFLRDRIQEKKKKKANENVERHEERRDKILWGLVFTHELHPDTGDEGGNIDPRVTHTRPLTPTYIYIHVHERARERFRARAPSGARTFCIKGDEVLWGCVFMWKHSAGSHAGLRILEGALSSLDARNSFMFHRPFG